MIRNKMIILCFFLLIGRSASGLAQIGSEWVQAATTVDFGEQEATALSYDNKLWVIGGLVGGPGNDDVWYSVDGANWFEATAAAAFGGKADHTSVVYDGKMWVIGSQIAADVWYSTNGVDWTAATLNAAFGKRGTHSSVVYDGKMWVIGGYTGLATLNDVWYSTDGATWLQATAAAAFGGRQDHSSVVYDGKMWLIGGGEGTPFPGTIKNDVWYSEDGANWIQATAAAAFSTRLQHTSVVFDDKMWVLGGGHNTSDVKSDVWYSEDGANWSQATGTAGFGLREAHVSAVFRDRMWVLGGWGDSFPSVYNDVWYSPPDPTPTITPTPYPAGVILVFPNPFNPDKAVGGTLKFKGLPDGAKVSIYTVSGELVQELTEEGGAAFWDGKNKSGAMVSIGSYAYVIKKDKETLKCGKIVIVR